MKKAFILLSLSLMLASCATAYQQIATVQSSQATHSRDGKLSFSSDNVVVDYDFWSLGGEVSFVLTNKSDNDIYIDLSRSFLVVNGMTFDYFKNRTYSSTFTNVVYNPSQGKSSAYAMAKNMDNAAKNTTINGAFGKSASRGVEYVEKEGVWVPAHSSRYFNEFTLMDNAYRKCGLARDPSKREDIKMSFTEKNSPIIFDNVLMLVVNGQDQKLVNSFFIGSFKNVLYSQAYKNEPEHDCNGRKNGCFTRVAQNYAADRFFLNYILTGGSESDRIKK